MATMLSMAGGRRKQGVLVAVITTDHPRGEGTYIGVMDERGYLRITDRLKDMYIMNGENVYPAEVEKLLYGLDGVAQAAVIGVPKAPQGEVGMAFIVRRAGSELSAEQVKAFCAEQLARYKLPYYVAFVDALPMNASGKVLKTELAAQAAQHIEAQA